MKVIYSYLFFPVVLIFLLSLSSCEKKDDCEELAPCNRTTVKKIKNQEGIVHYDGSREEYYIRFIPEGTYDSQYLAYPCNSLAEEFRQEGIEVEVTGNFKNMCAEIQAAIGGVEYYYLKISAISRTQAQTDE